MANRQRTGRAALREAARDLRMRVRAAEALASQRLVRDFRLLVPKTLAAMVAWFLARLVADHDDPFFAPIAAVVALNAPLGQRGVNAFRVIIGVFIGIVSGETVFRFLGGGYGTLGLAVFIAMAIATMIGGRPIVVGQAASSAILTMVSARIEMGGNRLEDALIGAGVALVLSQFLFSPEPVAMLRRAQSTVLREASIGLSLIAEAFAREDDDRALLERALAAFGALRPRLLELAEVGRGSDSTARHSLIWRWARRPALSEARADNVQIDRLGGSCLVLAHIAGGAPTSERASLAPLLLGLGQSVGELAEAPADAERRARAAERAREVRSELGRVGGLADGGDEVALRAAVRMIASDVIELAWRVPPSRAEEVAAEPA